MKLRNFLTLAFFALSPLSVSASEAIPYEMKNQLVEALQNLVVLESNFLKAVEEPVKSTFHPMGVKVKKTDDGEDLLMPIKGTLNAIAVHVSGKSTDADIIDKGWRPLQSQQKSFLRAIIQKVTAMWENKNTKQYKEKIQNDLAGLQNLQTQLQGMDANFTLANIQAYHTIFATAQQHYNSAVAQFKS